MIPKTPSLKFVMYLSPEDQRILTAVREEQHAKLLASGALLGPPTAQDIVRTLIAREGVRLDAEQKITGETWADAGEAVAAAIRETSARAMDGLSQQERAIVEQRMNRSAGAPVASPPSDTTMNGLCRVRDEHGAWPVCVPVDRTDDHELAIVNDETIAIYKRANANDDRPIVFSYLRSQKQGERFTSPRALSYGNPLGDALTDAKAEMKRILWERRIRAAVGISGAGVAVRCYSPADIDRVPPSIATADGEVFVTVEALGDVVAWDETEAP